MFAMLMMAAGVSIAAAQSTDKPVGNLRLAIDSSGTAMQPESGSPAEKVYKLKAGLTELFVAYDFQGTESTKVSIRVLGPNGNIEFQEDKVVDSPGIQVVHFQKEDGTITDNEYIINAYIGDQNYLADSLQLAVGAAIIPESPSTEIARATDANNVLPTAIPTPVDGGGVPNTGPGPLVLAGVLLLVLGGVVVWAVRSAMAGGKS
jgi:hypothetical protein